MKSRTLIPFPRRSSLIKKAVYAFGITALAVLSFSAGRHYTHNTGAITSARRVLYYTCPMHPAYKSDKPGIAPCCGMQLVPVYADGGDTTSAEGSSVMPAGSVRISLDQQQLIGMRVAPVEKSSGAQISRVLGRVVADETRVFKLNAAIDGYIMEVTSDSTGSLVKKGQKLGSFGGSDVLSDQQLYLRNLKLYPGALRALGMSDVQLKELAATNTPVENINLYSPIDGFILQRNIWQGQRFEKGAEFYRIADLSHVWILADIYESDAQNFRPGTMATVRLPGQNKSLHARVSNVLPQFDSATRTMKLRLESENPDFVLRPDMFVDVELPAQVSPGLTVPADALLDSGLKKRVFLDKGDGYFEQREVETGWRFGDRVQIVRGLAEGDRVVVSGTFMVDSESRLKEPQRAASKDSQVKTVSQVKTNTEADPVKDPVCGMDLERAKAVSENKTESYRGKTYYFCSRECRDKFHKHPEQYVKSSREINDKHDSAPKMKASVAAEPTAGMDAGMKMSQGASHD